MKTLAIASLMCSNITVSRVPTLLIELCGAATENYGANPSGDAALTSKTQPLH